MGFVKTHEVYPTFEMFLKAGLNGFVIKAFKIYDLFASCFVNI